MREHYMPETNPEPDNTSCEGCGDDDASYRDEMGVYACEGCHDEAVRAYMAVFE